MPSSKPIRGKVVAPGVVEDAARRIGNVVRSEDVRRAMGDVIPAARRLGDAVLRAWQR